MSQLAQVVQEFGSQAGIEADTTPLQNGGAVAFAVGDNKTLYLENSARGEVLVSLEFDHLDPKQLLGLCLPQNTPFQLTVGITKGTKAILVARTTNLASQDLEKIVATLLNISARHQTST